MHAVVCVVALQNTCMNLPRKKNRDSRCYRVVQLYIFSRLCCSQSVKYVNRLRNNNNIQIQLINQLEVLSNSTPNCYDPNPP